MGPVHSNMRLLTVFFLFGAATASLQDYGNKTKREIEESRESAQTRMEKAVGKVASYSVFVIPRKKLKELSEAGIGDVDAIRKFDGPGNKKEAMDHSLQFWKDKMEEVIQPYLLNPERYKGLIIDFARIPEDPKSNGSAEYKKVEVELNELADSAIAEMQSELDQHSGKPVKCLSGVTKSSWKKLQGQRALNNATFAIEFKKQLLKSEAAGGNTSEIPEFKTQVSTIVADYKTELNDIYSS